MAHQGPQPKVEPTKSAREPTFGSLRYPVHRWLHNILVRGSEFFSNHSLDKEVGLA